MYYVFFAKNWQGYEQIKFSFFNQNQEALKVRFGKWLMIDSGWNDYNLLLIDIKNSLAERKMALRKMAGVDFYMYQLNKPINLYIKRIELISNWD